MLSQKLWPCCPIHQLGAVARERAGLVRAGGALARGRAGRAGVGKAGTDGAKVHRVGFRRPLCGRGAAGGSARMSRDL